jgi:hypothetical protein
MHVFLQNFHITHINKITRFRLAQWGSGSDHRNDFLTSHVQRGLLIKPALFRCASSLNLYVVLVVNRLCVVPNHIKESSWCVYGSVIALIFWASSSMNTVSIKDVFHCFVLGSIKSLTRVLISWENLLRGDNFIRRFHVGPFVIPNVNQCASSNLPICA